MIVLCMSTGLAGTFHQNLLGVYELDQDDFGKNVSQHNRHVFRHVNTNDNWLYYWDWGPNGGTNWMVADKYWDNKRSLESQNLENQGQFSVCVEDLHQVGPMKVWNPADGLDSQLPLFDTKAYNLCRAWQTDWSLRVECYDDSIDCCDRVGLTSSGILQNTYPELLNTEYLFYTGLQN